MKRIFVLFLQSYIILCNILNIELVVMCQNNDDISDAMKVPLRADISSDISVHSSNIVQTSSSFSSSSSESPLLSKLPIPIGQELGITSYIASTNVISQNSLQKIIQGVENNNKESIYYFALLKLYGIAVTQSLDDAVLYFHQAAELGHIEARTAYGVMYMMDYDHQSFKSSGDSRGTNRGKANGRLTKNPHVAMNAFKLAAMDGDADALWLIAK